VPLYNLYQRFFRPLEKYRRIITHDLEPAYVDREIAVVGINTARSMVFKGGRVNQAQMERVRLRLCDLGEHVTKVIVTHHPFDLPQAADPSHIVGRAARAIQAFTGCGADLLLAGHLHLSHAGDSNVRYALGGKGPLVIQAGTATSTRGRGEGNSFNAIRIEAGKVAIERYEWRPGERDFLPAGAQAYERTPQGWAELQNAGCI
jgi:hypothetical protein